MRGCCCGRGADGACWCLGLGILSFLFFFSFLFFSLGSWVGGWGLGRRGGEVEGGWGAGEGRGGEI